MRKEYQKPCMGICKFSADDVVKTSGKTTLEKSLDQLGIGYSNKDKYYLMDNSDTTFQMNK